MPDQSRPWEPRGGEEMLWPPPPPASPTQGRRAPAQAFPPKQLETPGSAGQAQLV